MRQARMQSRCKMLGLPAKARGGMTALGNRMILERMQALEADKCKATMLSCAHSLIQQRTSVPQYKSTMRMGSWTQVDWWHVAGWYSCKAGSDGKLTYRGHVREHSWDQHL